MAIDDEVQAGGIPGFQRIVKVAQKAKEVVFADAPSADPFLNPKRFPVRREAWLACRPESQAIDEDSFKAPNSVESPLH